MPRAFIVDDIEENLHLLRVLLTANGYEVTSARNGAEALALARNSKPELIITDLLMPVMDGFTLCQTCRKTPEFADIPIIVYTATYTDPEDEDLALKQGADLFLIKPLEPDVLLNAINALMRAHQAGLRSRRPALEPNENLIRQYNSVLVRKLENKIKELDAAQRRLNAIFEGISQGFITVSMDGVIRAVNRRLEKMFGYDRAELVGRQLEVLLPERFWERHVQQRDQYRSQPEVRTMGLGMELMGRRKDGSEFPVEVGLSYIQEGDGIEVIALVTDVTERRHMEEKLHKAQRMEALGTLAGGIAHDFNNLLTVIIGYSKLMLETAKMEPTLRTSLEFIDHAADNAAKLTRQLLAFSRRQVLQPKIMDMNEEVEHLHRMMRRLIGGGISLETVLSPELGTIKADPGQVEQVIMNLLLNARDSMPKGGVLTLSTENVELHESDAQEHDGALPGSYVMLAVSDTGGGMDPETMTRMFDPFFTTKEVGKGTGLGLSTVHGIVAQSGGHVCVSSEKGKGSSFKIYFPRTAESE